MSHLSESVLLLKSKELSYYFSGTFYGFLSGTLDFLSALGTFMISVTMSEFSCTIDGLKTGTSISTLGTFMIFWKTFFGGFNCSGVTLFDDLYREDFDIEELLYLPGEKC